MSAERVPARGILILSLTNACACRCVFCGLPEAPARDRLSAGALAAALENPPGGGVWAEVNVTGGDPLVIPGVRALFPELHARRALFRVLSVSSAGVPANAAIAGLDALDDGGPLALYVSVDGVGARHDAIRRRPGAFDEVRRFLDDARRRESVTVALTCVINRMNVDALDDLADWAARERLVVSYAVVNSSDHYIRSEPLYDAVKLSGDDLLTAVDFLRRRSHQRLDDDLIRVLSGGRRETPCRLLDDGFLLTPDGVVSICGTSTRMILGRVTTAADWAAVAARRADVASRARGTCAACTTNCFARRHDDDRVVRE